MSDNFELLACLKMAAGLPCDPRHRKTLLQAADEIDKLQTQITAAKDEVERLRNEMKEAGAQGGEAVGIIRHINPPESDDPDAMVEWLFGGDEINLPHGTKLYIHHDHLERRK